MFLLLLRLSQVKETSNDQELIQTGPEVIKLFSCSSIEHVFFLLINVQMPTIVGILTFMNRKNSILGLSESEKAEILHMFILKSI